MCVYCTYILFDYEENYSTFCLHQTYRLHRTCCWYNNKNHLSRYWMPLPYVLFSIYKNKPHPSRHLSYNSNSMSNVWSFLSNTWQWLCKQFVCKFDKYAKRCALQCEPGPSDYKPNHNFLKKPPSQAKKSPPFLSSAVRNDKFAVKFFTGNFVSIVMYNGGIKWSYGSSCTYTSS